MFLESVGGRKFVFTIIGALILFGAYILKDKMGGEILVGGIVALAGVFVEGNVRSKKILNESGGKKK